MYLLKDPNMNVLSRIINKKFSMEINQPKYPLTGKWLNKWWYSHTMEYYPTINKIALLIHINKSQKHVEQKNPRIK